MFLLFSVSLVQVNLSLELFENRIFVRGRNDFHLKFFVRKPNCSNCETFENRGLTVPKTESTLDFVGDIANFLNQAVNEMHEYAIHSMNGRISNKWR